MRHSTQPQHEVRNTPAESFGRIARRTATATPVLLAPARGSANEGDIASREAFDASARRAQAANGFGDALLFVAGDAGPGSTQGFERRSAHLIERPTAWQLEVAARLDRSRRIGELAIAIWRAVAEQVSRLIARLEQRQESSAADLASPVRPSIAFAPGDSPLLYKTEGVRDLVAAVSRWAAGVVRRNYDAWRRRRLARATYMALRDLDDRTLRDIGLDRSELRSIAAEVGGALEITRMHAVHVELSY